MKKGYREEQMLYVLKRVAGGRKVVEICGEIGISTQTYHRWKKRYAGIETTEMMKLRQLEDENARLREMVGSLSLHKYIFQKLLSVLITDTPNTAISRKR